MQYVIQSYLRNPSDVKVNLRKIISNSNFNRTFAEENCRYYVVHKGKISHVSKQRDDESIITLEHLQTILDSITIKSVPHANIRIDELSNAAQYDKVDGISSLLCNMSGYDLAVLNNKYINTALGRNILFGQNLRDSLNKKSKTYTQMISTIDDEPENFWYYNNGISIIASKANLKEGQFVNPETNEEFSHDGAFLKDFSIINGAQTVSTLGAYLSDAEINRDFSKIRKLQKVYVLARAVEIPDKKHKLRNKISIFNNSQNPITTRDMVSNNDEQIKLNHMLLAGNPPIFMEIRRGTNAPREISFLKHRERITNEELAQLAFAGFLKQPFKAKDKKKTLFNNTFTKEWTVNEDYHSIFNYNNGSEKGILFEKSSAEIDELIFIRVLHTEAKKYIRNQFKEMIAQLKVKLENSTEHGKPSIENQIRQMNRNIEIVNVCLFYTVALYYEFKDTYDTRPDLRFDMEKYYSDKSFKDSLVASFESVFVEKTIEIIRDLSDTANVNNWVRKPINEQSFLNRLSNDISLKLSHKSDYLNFVQFFKK